VYCRKIEEGLKMGEKIFNTISMIGGIMKAENRSRQGTAESGGRE
jgi:hypothetical protein